MTKLEDIVYKGLLVYRFKDGVLQRHSNLFDNDWADSVLVPSDASYKEISNILYNMYFDRLLKEL